MIARTRNSFITRQRISDKLEYDELGIELPKNVTHSLEVVDRRHSLNRAKTLSPVRSSSSQKVAKEKTGEYVSDETIRREHHRQELETFPCGCKVTEDKYAY